jgi:uncharacterized membrane protein
MDFKTITLFAAVVLTGLSAGLFYAWSVSVIPGTLKIQDSTYLETMQSINRGILNPRFFLIFFGSLICLGIASALEFQNSKPAFYLLLASTLIYLVGTLGVTGMGNVPLNDQLEVLNLKEMNLDQLSEFREHYELKWNKFHLIRTICAVLAFALSVGALIIKLK